MKGHCILSHGFESGPDATKVTALAEAAERLGGRLSLEETPGGGLTAVMWLPRA